MRTAALRILMLLSLAIVAAPTTTQAVVPPKDCGRMTLKDRRYQIKADQISCATGRRHAKAYVERGVKPTGYSCKRYPVRRNRVSFYCNDGRKVFFAIRR